MNILRHLAPALLLCLTSGGLAQDRAARPNVLVLMADDLGWNDVGFHSRRATTPSLDRLAAEGVELRRFYAYPVCSPTRAALLTGQMPRRFGIAGIVGPQQAGLPSGVATLPSTLRSAGYQTSLIGKWHLGSGTPPMKCGFDHFCGFMGAEIDYVSHTTLRGGNIDWQRDGKTVNEPGYSTDLFADEAIRRIKRRDAGRPFYMQVAFNAPHFPLAAPQNVVVQHKGDVYRAAIHALDIGIGRILSALDEQGLRDNTLVVFFSDNGGDSRESSSAPFNGGKGTIFEGGIRTPCVMRWPGRLRAGAVTQHPVATQDLFPTLAAAAQVPLSSRARLDGTSQWPALLSGKPAARAPFLIAATDIAVIDGDWKLIEWNSGQISLFNLRADVSESKDQYGRQPEVARRLTATLYELKRGLPPASAARGPMGKGKGKGPPRGMPR